MLRYWLPRFSFFLTAFCLLAGMFACQPKEDEVAPPQSLVNQEKMVEALVAIHILEQQVAESKLDKHIKEDSFIVYQNEVFQRVGIDSVAYFESYNYYLTQVDQFHQIMSSVTDSIGYLRDNVKDNPIRQQK